MKSKKSVMPVQDGLGRGADGSTLETLWFELPSYCNLACTYCFANGGESINVDDLISEEKYTEMLDEAKSLGVKSVGIPGAGEPFVGKNIDLTMKLLEMCKDRGFYTTIFTTGEFITEELADKLFEMPVELMIKCNSLDPDVQNTFVSDPARDRTITHYGQKRNEVLDMLIEKGFNKPFQKRKSRLAIVTSIMTGLKGGPSNYDEMADLLRYARDRNIIFDCDSVLERGRGAGCKLITSDQMIKDKQLELQKIDRKEYGKEWEISQSYIGTVCDRFAHHMYVNQSGKIRPCIGAMDVKLGNIKTTTLAEAWDRPEMQIIRNRNYKGKCGDECANFEEKKCNSCLGRRTDELNNDYLLEHGHVKTIGCWNFKQKEK
ncbi:radical SAM protein [Nanoarchaeota archaeon]